MPDDRVQMRAAARTPLPGDAVIGAASVCTALDEDASASVAATAVDTGRVQRPLAEEEEGEAAGR